MKSLTVLRSAKNMAAASLLLASCLSNAGVPTPPTDISLGIPTDRIQPGNDLIEVGGPGDFGMLAPAGASEADDSVASVDVSSVMDSGFNFYGTTYNAATQFNISSNGHVNLGNGFATISPNLASSITNKPFFLIHSGDMDTRAGSQPAGVPSAGGNSTGTNDIFYHLDAVNDVITITFDDVGRCCGTAQPVNDLTAAQMRFHDIGSGNFVVEYRFENVGWAAGRELGWSAGDLVNYDNTYNTTSISTKSNINQPGVFAWMFINGKVVPADSTVLERADNGTIIGALSTNNTGVGPFTFSLLDDADGRFEISVIDGTPFVVVKDGTRINHTINDTHDIHVKVVNNLDQEYDEVITITVIKRPAFNLPTEIHLPVGESVNITVNTGVDPTSGIPSITALSLPVWMNFADNGNGTATLSGFPSFDMTFKATLQITDSIGNVTTKTFNVIVMPEQTNKGNSPNENTNETVTVTVTTEEEGEAGSFAWLLVLLVGGLLMRRRT